jgi:hypothetical protein
MLEKFVSEICSELPIEASTKDADQWVHLTVNPTLRVSVKALDPGIIFSAPIGEPPLQKREDFYMLVMKANFLGQGTGGGTLSLDGDEKLLTLSLALPYDMNFKNFKEHLEDFANFVDYWKQELRRHTETTQK